MPRKQAVTLIELLVVIAIIAILAAIIMPVLARAKNNAYRNSDISNMNSIRSALQLYRVDQGAYPPALLGYATLYSSGPNMGQIMPANELRSFLYTKRIPSLDTLRPSFNKNGFTLTTTAVWPNQDPRPVGTAAAYDADGDGNLTPADDLANARQAFGPTQVVERPDPSNPGTFINAEFYRVSGYDVSEVPVAGGLRWELRYALFWTVWGLSTGNAADDPRQLGYDDPSDETVITWNSYFRNWTAGVPNRERQDLVLFLGGGARPHDSRDMHERSWRNRP
ncbi:MAG TPA: prepilin-type N-terminal cleavage/methylation domain-containing protein [Fimbriimonadaceae bacterium]|nr:prepilin-type N-terminal cleavage/methylation domain-containing protein [Fimbriimonadaceae bacterium]